MQAVRAPTQAPRSHRFACALFEVLVVRVHLFGSDLRRIRKL